MPLKLDCGTFPEATVHPTIDCKAMVLEFPTSAAVQLSNVDMAEWVRYWLTNTDLNHEDARTGLIEWIAGLKIVDGYNPGGKRLSPE